MGIVEAIGSRRVYLDVNVFIYALESHALYLPVVQPLFAAIANGGVCAITSELSLAEALVKPMMLGSESLQRVYEEAFSSGGNLRVSPVSRSVLVESARIRAASRVRLPDAIHLATARLGGCDIVVTNDLNLGNAAMRVIRLSEFVSRV